jgi:hypothetical protein
VVELAAVETDAGDDKGDEGAGSGTPAGRATLEQPASSVAVKAMLVAIRDFMGSWGCAGGPQRE